MILTISILYNTYFYLLLIALLTLLLLIIISYNIVKKKNSEIKLIYQQHVAKVDSIRKEHSDTLEKIRVEMLKREEERGRLWAESERETLFILNGVSTLLDLSEKIGRVEADKILKKLDEIQTVQDDIIMKKINEIREKVEKLQNDK